MRRGRQARQTAYAVLVPAVLVLAALALAGCGSQVSAATIARAEGGVSPVGPTDATEVAAGAAADGPEGTGADAGDRSASAVAGAGVADHADPAGTGSPARHGGTRSPPEADVAPADPGAPVTVGGARPGSCRGFHDQTGVTDDTITIANASDLSGPVPGLFESSQDAVEAFAAYFDATTTVCGRTLRVIPLDTRTDAGADQQAAARACTEAFATVGSMAAFDSGGAAITQDCGLPDLRSATVTHDRDDCTTCFAAQSGNPTEFPDSVPEHLVREHPDAVGHAAYLWINAGPAVENAAHEIRAWSEHGVHFDYTAAIDISDFDYTPYVRQLQNHHIRLVRFLGAADEAVRLDHAMHQQGYRPEVVLLDATGYDPAYVENGGADVEGTEVFVNFRPFEEAARIPEMRLYLDWLQQVHPGAAPTYAGLFSWSAARLFSERALHLGGRLTRASMVRSIASVDDWTDHGAHPPQHVGDRQVGQCWRFLRLVDGRWVPSGGTRFECGPITRVG